MLPKKSITRTIRKAGAHRVSKDASLELVNYLEDSTTKISQKAVRYAKHLPQKYPKKP
jgi:histone H3/H4